MLGCSHGIANDASANKLMHKARMGMWVPCECWNVAIVRERDYAAMTITFFYGASMTYKQASDDMTMLSYRMTSSMRTC